MFEHFWVDFEKCSPAAPDRIVDQDVRGAVGFADAGEGIGDLSLAGDIADDRVGVRKLLLERANAIRRTGERDHPKSATRKTPYDRGPGAGADTCNNRNRLVCHGCCLITVDILPCSSRRHGPPSGSHILTLRFASSYMIIVI